MGTGKLLPPGLQCYDILMQLLTAVFASLIDLGCTMPPLEQHKGPWPIIWLTPSIALQPLTNGYDSQASLLQKNVFQEPIMLCEHLRFQSFHCQCLMFCCNAGLQHLILPFPRWPFCALHPCRRTVIVKHFPQVHAPSHPDVLSLSSFTRLEAHLVHRISHHSRTRSEQNALPL